MHDPPSLARRPSRLCARTSVRTRCSDPYPLVRLRCRSASGAIVLKRTGPLRSRNCSRCWRSTASSITSGASRAERTAPAAGRCSPTRISTSGWRRPRSCCSQPATRPCVRVSIASSTTCLLPRATTAISTPGTSMSARTTGSPTCARTTSSTAPATSSRPPSPTPVPPATDDCGIGGVDLDAAITAQRDTTALTTELNQLNQRRNAHQASGKGKLPPEEREAHVVEGRRLKEEVAAHRGGAWAKPRPHWPRRSPGSPSQLRAPGRSPVGGEEDYNACCVEVGEPPRFDFAPLDHLQPWARSLDALRLRGRCEGRRPEVLLPEERSRRCSSCRSSATRWTWSPPRGLRSPSSRPIWPGSSVVDAIAFSPRGPETQIYSIADTDLDLIGTAEITLGGLYLDTIVDEDDLPIKLAGDLPLLPDRGGLRRAREQGPLPRAPVHARSRCSP